MKLIRTNLAQSGFSLIELVIVIVVLGILAAIAIPRYVDLQSEAQEAAAKGNEAALKSAYSIFIADSPTHATPAASDLAPYVSPQPTYNAGNFEFDVNGTTWYVPLYENSTCTDLVDSNAEAILCIGSASSTPAS